MSSELSTTLNQIAGPAIAVLTLLLVVVTAWYVYLTRQLVLENRALRKAGTEPALVAYLLPDRRHFIAINLVIANVGKGVAKGVRFELKGDAEDALRHQVTVPVGVARGPFGVLPPDERLVMFFGMSHQLLSPSPLQPLSVAITWEDTSGKEYRDEFVADVRPFEGLQSLGTPPEVEMAGALKQIANSVQHWSSHDRLRVETMTRDEVIADLERGREAATRQAGDPTAD